MIPHRNLDEGEAHVASDFNARRIALHNLTFPKEEGIVPIFSGDEYVTFAKAPCAWSVYKAQILEFYFLFMRSRSIAPVAFFIEGVGSVEISRDLVRSCLEDSITREFLDSEVLRWGSA